MATFWGIEGGGKTPYLLGLIILSVFRREVTIHVCDESRGMKKDFVCPQNLLLSRMIYFRYEQLEN
jgi:hypothetical protein